jgi:PhnB protein
MPTQTSTPVISLMLAVPNTSKAIEWYRSALGAKILWSLGSVAGLEINGAPFFLHEPVENYFNTPNEVGTTTVRIEMFAENPDEIISKALEAGAEGSINEIKNHQVPWGIHRQGGFTDPFGHKWLVGDNSPLIPHDF